MGKGGWVGCGGGGVCGCVEVWVGWVGGAGEGEEGANDSLQRQFTSSSTVSKCHLKFDAVSAISLCPRLQHVLFCATNDCCLRVSLGGAPDGGVVFGPALL